MPSTESRAPARKEACFEPNLLDPSEVIPQAAGNGIRLRPRAKIERLLARLELVLAHITELERERNAEAETGAKDHAAKIIQQLAGLRGIGVQSATVLVREAFARGFANGKAHGAYAGLTATSYSSGGLEREQGIRKAGNRRLRSVMVEVAWLWHAGRR